MKPEKIFLIRHAQSVENVLDTTTRLTVREYNELLRNSHASPLTLLGEKQARQLGMRLKTEAIERLYSSPYPRALSTATLLGEQLGLSPEVIEEAYEVQPVALKEHSQRLALLWHYLQSYTQMFWLFGGEENWLAHYRRARRVWFKLSHEPVAQVALVSHAWLTALMLLSLRGNPTWRVVKRDFSNCGVSIIERRNP